MNSKYIKGIVLLGLVASVGLQSCQITKKYKAPEVDSAGLFRDKEATDTTTIANISWKEYYKDPVLQALIEEGINNNHDLQIAYARIKQGEANLSMARAAYFPTVALAAQVNEMKSLSSSYHSGQYSLGIAASWELDLWGKLSKQKKSAQAQFMSSVEYKNLMQTSLIANISTSYYTLLALDNQLEVTRNIIGIIEKSTETMAAMMDIPQSTITRASVEQSKALLYSTRTSIVDLESNIRQIENSICVMLGRKPGYVFRNKLSDQTVPVALAYGVPAQMLAKRPDVKMAELSFRSAFELTQAARASFYPSITLSNGSMVGYGTQNTLSDFFKPENLFANIIGGITQPIFAKNQLTGQLKIRKAQQEEALLSFEQTVLNASKEVSNIMFTHEAALRKMETRASQVESLGTAVEDTQLLLEGGMISSSLEVLNAQQSLLQAEMSLINDKLEQLQASVNLYRALGGGAE